MKRSSLFLIIATAAALGCTTSCTQGDDRAVADGAHGMPISFNVGIGTASVPDVTTRGYTTDYAHNSGYTFLATDVVSIGITGVSGSSRSTTSEEIKQYTVAAGTGQQSLTYSKDANGSTTQGFDWLSQSETVRIRAWSYGNSDTPATDPDGHSFAISTTQGSDTSIQELLYSPSTNYPYGNIIIPLYHQLARVVVNITGTIYSDVTVTGVTIGDDNIPTSGTFTKPTGSNKYGTWPAQSGNGSVSAKQCTTTSTDLTNNKATYAAVIIPYDGTAGSATYYKANDKFIVINTNQGTYSYKIPASGINFQPGNQYTFNITNLNQIDLNVTVTAWTDDSTNSETVTFSN